MPLELGKFFKEAFQVNQQGKEGYKTPSPQKQAEEEFQSFTNEMESFYPSKDTDFLGKPDQVVKGKEEFKTISQKGIDFIISKENFKEQAYLDSAGIPTIGYGSTRIDDKPVTLNTKITKEKALEQKKKDIEFVQKSIYNNVKVPINQNQFDALVSLGYNIGAKTLVNSTIISKLNSGQEVKEEDFLAFNKSKDPKTKKLTRNEGLETRRKEEYSFFVASN